MTKLCMRSRPGLGLAIYKGAALVTLGAVLQAVWADAWGVGLLALVAVPVCLMAWMTTPGDTAERGDCVPGNQAKGE